MADVAKLEAVLDYIRTHPEEHDQSTWVERTPCGTTMCFAGTAVMLAGHSFQWLDDSDQVPNGCVVPKDHPLYSPYWVQVSELATYELNLTELQANDLFYEADTFDDVEATVKDIINNQRPGAHP